MRLNFDLDLVYLRLNKKGEINIQQIYSMIKLAKYRVLRTQKRRLFFFFGGESIILLFKGF